MPQAETILFKRTTIVGPGLLGASIAMGLREKNISGEIWIWLRDEKKVDACGKSYWCDRALIDLKEAVKGSDLIILCTPVDSILDQLDRISQWAGGGCLVTDVGSLKKEICERAEQVFENKSSIFIGSHPMAGSEKAGMEFASSKLLVQKHCIVTPAKNTGEDEISKITMLWKRLGMEVSRIGMEKHDEVISWISHLPHLVASSLINAIISRNPKMIKYSGNGLRDTTRIASGNPKMWMQILLGNKENLQQGIEDLIKSLEEFKEALSNGDRLNLLKILQSAKDSRDLLDED
jgi:cyclohexadieny/prephenate dehydrogenase